MEKMSFAFFWGALTFLNACGQDVSRSALNVNPNINPILVDPGSGGNSSRPFGDPLGRHSFSVVVNRALVGIGTEESENQFALLRTLPGPNSPGAYYGIGLGNQAQIGFGVHSAGLSVKAFEGLRFRVFESSDDQGGCGTHVRLNLLVDLRCDSLNPDYRVVTTGELIPDKKDVWTQFEIGPDSEVFRFSRTSGSPRSLNILLKNQPLACFVAGDVFDLGMKRNQKLAPFQLIYGDRFYFQSGSLRLDDLQLQIQGERKTEDFES
ncbi:MAG: hypothetical protein KGP28_13015 [Bdellovibrionales bacterium]|nr:hypothetical protein [Bdellovibrionales bacterium]